MDWIHLKPSDGRAMPWKNGAGTTVELAVDPPGASLGRGFRWRLSSAEVASSGAFSAFPGLERCLLLLEGSGFEVDFGPRGRVALREPLVPTWFSGDWPAAATLLEGPCVDFNVMWDPQACSAGVEVLSFEGPLSLDLGGAPLLLFVARGTVAVPSLDLHLGRKHTLRLEGETGALAVAAGLGGATLVAVRIGPAPFGRPPLSS